ncbi:unnamed protein product [Trichogramma brassicae]|uniref:Uncharacterized protein n=1 Tax=Trichogramma brassicae TaxID=86971 RepID=A0A6H5IRJ3_9HYME|nr:unnamed protein product [Trichogramma brassicae]
MTLRPLDSLLPHTPQHTTYLKTALTFATVLKHNENYKYIINIYDLNNLCVDDLSVEEEKKSYTSPVRMCGSKSQRITAVPSREEIMKTETVTCKNINARADDDRAEKYTKQGKTATETRITRDDEENEPRPRREIRETTTRRRDRAATETRSTRDDNDYDEDNPRPGGKIHEGRTTRRERRRLHGDREKYSPETTTIGQANLVTRLVMDNSTGSLFKVYFELGKIGVSKKFLAGFNKLVMPVIGRPFETLNSIISVIGWFWATPGTATTTQ